jgi:hypothetical protein
MTVLELLKGKKVKVMTDAKVEVELVIDSAKIESHYVQTGPSTPENDWWPDSSEWETVDITFTNGFKKSYRSLSDINLLP